MSMSGMRRASARLAAVVGLMAVAAVPAAPANANDPDPLHGGKRHLPLVGALVNFRTGAIFSCINGADNTGVATANTANITATLTTVSAVVTVHALPGTSVFGELTQAGCARLKFFSFTVPASGVGTTTVTDLRITGGAFVSFSDTAGEFQITPIVSFF